MAVDNPHFRFPFTMNAVRALVNEQDEDDDVLDCTTVLLLTDPGERDDIPEYGLGDLAFTMGGVDSDEILEAITTWEPRATVQIDDNVLEDTVQTVIATFSLTD